MQNELLTTLHPAGDTCSHLDCDEGQAADDIPTLINSGSSDINMSGDIHSRCSIISDAAQVHPSMIACARASTGWKSVPKIGLQTAVTR